MNSVIKLADFVASHGNGKGCRDAQIGDLPQQSAMAETKELAEDVEELAGLPDISSPGKEVSWFTQADIDAAEERGRAEATSVLENALARHKQDVEEALALAVTQIEAGVADVCAELLLQVCEEQIGRLAIQQLVRDARSCLAQVADSVSAPVLAIEGSGEFADLLEGMLQAAGIGAKRTTCAEMDDASQQALRLHVGDTVLEAMIERWRRDLRDCLQ